VIVPVGAADIDDVAALIAAEVPLQREPSAGDEVVSWWRPIIAPFRGDRDAVTRWRWRRSAIPRGRARDGDAEAEWRDA
jgi:hypothetical protein